MNPQDLNAPNANNVQPLVGQYVPGPAGPQLQGAVSTDPGMQPAYMQPPTDPQPMNMATLQPVSSAPMSLAGSKSGEKSGSIVWIGKAREISRTLRQDPFRESAELGRLKAAYLKERYGKEIKTGDDGQ